MNKKILHTLLLALILILYISAVQASDVNMTGSPTNTSNDINSIEVNLEPVYSNNLSTNNNNASLEDNSKSKIEFNQESANIYYGGSYNVTLKDANTNTAVSNKFVEININNNTFNATSDIDGVASVNLTLIPGKYTVNVYFAGDNTYDASNFTSNIEVLPTIQANNIVKYYKGSTQYSATFLNSYGNVLANTTVTITVNGKTYTKKTSDTGVASLPIDLKPGTYKVVSIDPITGFKLTTTFKILSTISANDVYKVAGYSKKFSAKFLKSNGDSLANKKIKFKLNGKTYSVKTNKNGKASLSLNNLKKGTYKIICYNKDGLSKTYKIKVYKKLTTKLNTNLYTFLINDNKVIKVTLTDRFDNTLSSGKTVKITVNGKTYSKKTQKGGVVKLKLPSLKKGVYSVKYRFDGSNYYDDCKASNKVYIITSENPTLTVKSTTSFGYGAGTPFEVAVTADGVPLAKKSFTFEINGVKYNRTTNTNGIASLPIKLGIGNYTVTYTVNKQTHVNNNKTGNCSIIVKQRTGTKLTWKSGTSFKDTSQTFKVLLNDVNGKALSGKTVKLTIGSKTYSAKTASNGYAKFKIKGKIGIYNVKVTYNGSNYYIDNSTSAKVTITLSKYIKGVNEKNTIKDLTAYLKSSSNCQVKNSKIKSLVKSLTKDLTSDVDKATAIFNYVRDTISYSFYYDTHFGAVGTLNAKRGNCVDHSHLLVAMFRTAGLEARYVHGSCTFSSGNNYGHVWSQVLIGNTWISADATSSRNSLGKIANWNTKSYTLKARYVSLPF